MYMIKIKLIALELSSLFNAKNSVIKLFQQKREKYIFLGPQVFKKAMLSHIFTFLITTMIIAVSTQNILSSINSASKDVKT